MAADCVFCRIAGGSIPAEVVYRGEGVLAFRDINPAEHVGALTDAPTGELDAAARCLAAAPAVAEQAGVTASGYRLVANQGADAGQIVPHFHLHLLGGRDLGAMG
ncbi:MAG: HIT domain-containing protein [Chloroflexota bacterium]|nr:HIT domain-containing protein [Chloroflexota bacterium]